MPSKEKTRRIDRPKPVDQTAKFKSSWWRLSLLLAVPYIAILALQMKVIWGITALDLTSLDSAFYFLEASRWHDVQQISMVYHPLYDWFYGNFIFFFNDAYRACITQRVVIVLLSSVLVLALFRRLLPKPLSWFAAAWWALLPANFNPAFEVHLFSIIPVLVACLVAGIRDSALARGTALAIMVIASCLMRNETILAAIPFAVLALSHDLFFSSERQQGMRPTLKHIATAYGAPLTISFLVVVWFYSISPVKFPELADAIANKARLVTAQTLAFSYAERHHVRGDPFLHYDRVLKPLFETIPYTLSQALMAQPKVVLEHISLNCSLCFNAVQLALFDGYSGTSPDFYPTPMSSERGIAANIFSVIALLLLVRGLYVWKTEKNLLWQQWFQDRRWTLLCLVCSAIPAMAVMILVRPRPEYIYVFSITLMWLVSTCAWLSLRGYRISSWLTKTAPGWAVAIIVLAPSYYIDNPEYTHRPFLRYYSFLKPFRSEIAALQTSESALVWPLPTRGILGLASTETVLDYVLGCQRTPQGGRVDYSQSSGRMWPMNPRVICAQDLLSGMQKDETLQNALDRMNVRMILIDRHLAQDLDVKAFMDTAEQSGWRLLTRTQPSDKGFRLYVKSR